MDNEESYNGPDFFSGDESNEVDYEFDAEQLEAVHGAGLGGDRVFRELVQGLVDLEQLSQVTNTGSVLADGHHSSELDRISRLFGLRVTASPQFTQSSIHISRHDEAQGQVEEEEEEEYESDEDYFTRQDRRGASELFPPVTEPQKPGLELLMSGEFGRIGPKVKSRAESRNLTHILHSRTTQTGAFAKEDLTSDLVPNSYGTAVASYDANIYSGQFSADSSFYYTCCQDFQLHIYDMTQPLTQRTLNNQNRQSRHNVHEYGHQSNMKVLKTIRGHHGRWTITDSHLSPNNEKIIYSSIIPTVYMTSTGTFDSDPVQVPINFSDNNRGSRSRSRMSEDDFGIWSCRFSADGNEVVAGGSGRIFVYDLLANRRTVKIAAHDADVNSCCWADTGSGNVLISASDDTFLKVWDRRSLGASPKPSGVLIGHTEGITYVSAKGDGRYIISNGKDQALRLWDLRKMRTNTEYESVKDFDYGLADFDYRYGWYSRPRYSAHPQDCSVMTYRGHEVFKTLIRCHFSPAETTGNAYIYSGSANGKIHIWSIDGRIVQVLDRAHTLPMTFDPSAPQPGFFKGNGHGVCVRDVSWSTKEPIIMSAGWEGSHGQSIVARHEWKGLSKLGGKLEDHVAKEVEENADRRTRLGVSQGLRRSLRTSRHLPGHFRMDDDGDGDEDDDEDY